MATYAKILKDNSGNSILPYTRSKFVYMDDSTTVEDSIGQVFADAVCEIQASGSINLILGQANRKIEYNSYPWTTANGTTISWESQEPI